MKRIRVLLVALMLSVALAPSLRASGPLSVLMKPPGTAPTTLLRSTFNISLPMPWHRTRAR